MHQAKSMTLEAKEITLFAFDLVSDGEAPGVLPTTARILDEEDGYKELDRVLLTHDTDIYPKGVRLFALVTGGRRKVQLEITGSEAELWRLAKDPYPFQTLHERLSGYEEWYAKREEFYSSSYFLSSGHGASGYEAGALDAARAAQEVFARAILQDAPFKSSLEFGCAAGAMVGALRSLGVDARGYDLSEYAISQAAPEIKDYVAAGDFSVLRKQDRRVEAVIGQEVFEHIPPSEVREVFNLIHEVVTRWLIVTCPCMPQAGIYSEDKFENLPRDSGGNPIQGHLVQGTWWWWAAQATLAGFEVDPSLISRVRRRWHDNSRWWNLYVCRRCEDTSPGAIRRRLDDLVRTSYEPLRQCVSDLLITTGTVARREGRLVIAASAQDAPGYLYYGPGMCAGTGTLDVQLGIRMPFQGACQVQDFTLPAVNIEICGSRGILAAYIVSVAELLEHRNEWIEKKHQFEVDGDTDVQVRIYFVGHADVELVWPVRCCMAE